MVLKGRNWLGAVALGIVGRGELGRIAPARGPRRSGADDDHSRKPAEEALRRLLRGPPYNEQQVQKTVEFWERARKKTLGEPSPVGTWQVPI